jgi:CheY-like chemotaxis protein
VPGASVTVVEMLLARQVESRQGFPALARFVLRHFPEMNELTRESPLPADTRPAPPVLVVEDDREQRETLGAMLDLEGFGHAEVANGREALDYLNEFQAPCVVLLDLEMPVMNGWDFRAEQLADERLARIPVVVVTANAEGLGDRFPGAAGLLWKPLNFEKLARVLGRICSRKKEGSLTTTLATA